jgi:hypothetical protein
MAFAYPQLLRLLDDPPPLPGVYVGSLTILSDEDFREVTGISFDANAVHLVVKLTPAAASRMALETVLGEHIATLVDGHLVSAAPLLAHLGSELPIFMSLHMPGEVAAQVAERLRARWPHHRPLAETPPGPHSCGHGR